MRWVLASANSGKRREFAALLAPRGIELVLQSALGIDSIEETGATFEANALLKARHAAARSGLPALADDSGIEVAALGDRPGVHSARYAGPAADDAANNHKLLGELTGVGPARRGARYRCVLALVEPPAATPAERLELPGGLLLATGQWAGRIAAAPAGSGGFGYDTIFIPEGHTVTAAELPAAVKNAHSHRAAALAALLRQLEAGRCASHA